MLEPNGQAKKYQKSKSIQLKREKEKANQQHKSMGGGSAHEAYISPSKVVAFANRPEGGGGWVCVLGGGKKKMISHNKAELL